LWYWEISNICYQACSFPLSCRLEHTTPVIIIILQRHVEENCKRNVINRHLQYRTRPYSIRMRRGVMKEWKSPKHRPFLGEQKILLRLIINWNRNIKTSTQNKRCSHSSKCGSCLAECQVVAPGKPLHDLCPPSAACLCHRAICCFGFNLSSFYVSLLICVCTPILITIVILILRSQQLWLPTLPTYSEYWSDTSYNLLNSYLKADNRINKTLVWSRAIRMNVTRRGKHWRFEIKESGGVRYQRWAKLIVGKRWETKAKLNKR